MGVRWDPEHPSLWNREFEEEREGFLSLITRRRIVTEEGTASQQTPPAPSAQMGAAETRVPGGKFAQNPSPGAAPTLRLVPPCSICNDPDMRHDTRHHELVREHDGCPSCGGRKQPGRDQCRRCELRGVPAFRRGR